MWMLRTKQNSMLNSKVKKENLNNWKNREILTSENLHKP